MADYNKELIYKTLEYTIPASTSTSTEQTYQLVTFDSNTPTRVNIYLAHGGDTIHLEADETQVIKYTSNITSNTNNYKYKYDEQNKILYLNISTSGNNKYISSLTTRTEILYGLIAASLPSLSSDSLAKLVGINNGVWVSQNATNDLYVAGKANITNSISVGGNINVGGSLYTTGSNISANVNTISMSGDNSSITASTITANSNLTVTGSTEVKGDLDANQNLTVTGNLSLTGDNSTLKMDGAAASISTKAISITGANSNINTNTITMSGDNSSITASTITANSNLTVTGSTEVKGDLDANQNLTVGENATISGDLTVNGSSSSVSAAKLDITGTNANVSVGSLSLTGNDTINTGTLNITGNLTTNSLTFSGASAQIKLPDNESNFTLAGNVTVSGNLVVNGSFNGTVGVQNGAYISKIAVSTNSNLAKFPTASNSKESSVAISYSTPSFTIYGEEIGNSSNLYKATVNINSVSAATNLLNGTAYQIPYQSAASSTTFIYAPNTTSSQFLVFDSSNMKFQWNDLSSINANTVNVTSNTNTTDLYLSFVSSGSTSSVNYNDKLKYNPNTNTVTASTFIGNLNGNASTATTLQNAGNITFSGDVHGATLWGDGNNYTCTMTYGDASNSFNAHDTKPISVSTVYTNVISSVSLGTCSNTIVVYKGNTSTNHIINNVSNAYIATIANSLSTSTAGSNTQFIYFNEGKPVAATSNIGSSSKPIYISNGIFKEIENELKSAAYQEANAFLSSSTKVVKYSSESSIGSANTPVYVSNGTVTAASEMVTVADTQNITGVKTFTSESQFLNTEYVDHWCDIASGIGKSALFARGAFTQAIMGQIIAPYTANTNTYIKAPSTSITNPGKYDIDKGILKFQYISSVGTNQNVGQGQPILKTMATMEESKFKIYKNDSDFSNAIVFDANTQSIKFMTNINASNNPDGTDNRSLTLYGTATFASIAACVTTAATTQNANYYLPVLSRTSGSQSLEVVEGITINPSTKTITATTFNGNATSASKIDVSTSTLTGSTPYYLLVGSSHSNNPQTPIYDTSFRISNSTLYVPNVCCATSATAQYFNATSDKRLKVNINPISETINAIDIVKNIPLYTFNYKDAENEEKCFGVIAQDIEDVDIDGFKLTSTNDAGYLTVKESKMVYLLMRTVQEQQHMIETLQSEVAALSGEILRMKNEG